mgnify:CR=1 FL=1
MYLSETESWIEMIERIKEKNYLKKKKKKESN